MKRYLTLITCLRAHSINIKTSSLYIKIYNFYLCLKACSASEEILGFNYLFEGS